MTDGLTIEEMEFLEAKGLSLADIIAFAKIARQPKPRSANAERQARWRSKKRGEPQQDNITNNVTRNALPPPIEDHTPPVSPIGENRAKRKISVPAAKPADVSDRTWSDWLDHRKRKGGTCTQTALDGIRAEAERAGWTLEAALSKAMQRNWQGFEAAWVAGQKAAVPDAADPLVASVLARKAKEYSG